MTMYCLLDIDGWVMKLTKEEIHDRITITNSELITKKRFLHNDSSVTRFIFSKIFFEIDIVFHFMHI